MQPINDNDLLRQAQWWTFGTCPVKNTSFELDIKFVFFFFFFFFFSFQDMQSFEFLSVIIILLGCIYFGRFEWFFFFFFCLKISDAKYFFLLSEALWWMINSLLFSNMKQKHNIISSCHMGSMYIETYIRERHPIFLQHFTF